VRSAVNIDDQRMFRSGRHTERLHEERFDVIFIVLLTNMNDFHVGDLLAAEQIGIQSVSCFEFAPLRR